MLRRESASSHIVERVALKLPFHTYFDVFRRRSCPFLLDSASDPQKLGRYSFMGADPFMVFRAKRTAPRPGQPNAARITIFDGRPEPANLIAEYEADPFDELRQLLAAHAVDRDAYAPRPAPLLAGAVGYLGYEAGYFVEALPDQGRDDLGLPDMHLGFYNATLVHCHRTMQSYVSVIGRGANARIAEACAQRKRDEIIALISAMEESPPKNWDAPLPSERGYSTTHVDEQEYCALVERMKEHIFAGDIFEGCLTHRIESRFSGDPWDLYRELRRVNPAPFACYLGLPEAQIVSSSPERFLRLGADRTAESRPIKGTRPRGRTDDEDQALLVDLQSAVKDQAENNMIVDLVRSDFGRVCRFGTVHVPELRIIERYATVYQMVSTILGQLDEGRDAIDLLRACFPGGSMTGAPKVEAMKIIDALEPVKRGVYSGSIGYLDFSGAMDFNIVIRTITLKDGRAICNVGGAIVADSVGKAEYQETFDKARALITALRNVASR